MNDPMLNGQIDAIGQVEPFRSALMATGKAEIIAGRMSRRRRVGYHAVSCAHIVGREKSRYRRQIRPCCYQRRQVRQDQRGCRARSQRRLYQAQPGSQGPGAAPGTRDRGERRRNGAHHGADAKKWNAAEAHRHFEPRVEAALNIVDDRPITAVPARSRVSKIFAGAGGTTVALNDIELDVARGSFVQSSAPRVAASRHCFRLSPA